MSGPDLNAPVEIVIGDRSRRISADDLPLSVGGPAADLPVLGIEASEPLALVGVSEGRLFVQPHGDEPLSCNGKPITTAQWLYDGDVIRIGANRIIVAVSPELVRFTLQQPTSDNVTLPPSSAIGRTPAQRAQPAEPTTVKPVEFHPRSPAQDAARRGPIRPLAWSVWLLVLLLAAAAWVVFTSRSVEIVVEPEPDRVVFHGGLSRLGLTFGGRHLVRPGSYRLEATREGHVPLDVRVEVTRESRQSHRFTMSELPGFLALDVGGVEGARVLVDGAEAGRTPLPPLELAAGEHELRILSDRHEEYATTLSIEGAGATRELTVALVPRWAEVKIRSRPPGATILVDGAEVGVTPASVELMEGKHALDLRLAGYKPQRRRIAVVAREPLELPPIELELLDGFLAVRSDPAGAVVTLNGSWRGVTPLDLHLAPGSSYEVRLTKPGYEEVTRSVSLRSAGKQKIEVALPVRFGEVTVSSTPADAELWVDGRPQGAADQTLRLVAVPHEIEVRKAGYESYRTTVTPRPGFAQRVEAALKSAEQIRAEATPPVIRTSQGRELVRIGGGRFRMGASRREPGRRANETLREVEITRTFYIARHEVSNEDFREFRDEHVSGKAGSHSLSHGHHPVVRVGWDEAAAYCNWLSVRESLPPAYRLRAGRLEPVRPATIGYRLPTEAEWVFVARYPDGATAFKYAWGNSLPVPADGGNYGDESARSLLPGAIAGYDDAYPVTAPVDSFAPNALGLFHLGGNVSEWVQDYYVVYPSRGGEVARDPLGPESGTDHVIRGASWMDDKLSALRLSYRDYGLDPRPDVGFRIARYAE